MRPASTETMKTPSLTRTLFAAALLLACVLPAGAGPLFTQLPQADTYLPGYPSDKPLASTTSRGHLLPAMQDYLYLLRGGYEGSLLLHDAAFCRRVAIDVARRYPYEVNDRLRLADGTCLSPLAMAVQAQDAELVDLLLDLGALPLSPQPGVELGELPAIAGVTPRPELARQLEQARKGFDMLAVALENQGVKRPGPRGRHVATPPATTKEALETAHDNCYCGERLGSKRYVLGHAFHQLSHPGTVMLRVQPLSREVVYPGHGGHHDDYGSLTTTARIVKAVKGEAPAFETITWEIPTEGPADAPEGHSEFPADAEPMFLDLSKGYFEKARSKDGDKNIDLGMVDFDIVTRGEEWQAAFDRVLADFPELAETVPATDADLAAACKVLDKAPVVARATIWRYWVKLDEEAGTATVTYSARLRDPLKGALIKGVLRDWSNVQFSRTFPISDALRRRQAGFNCYLELPAILVFDEAEGKREVLQSFNGEDDPSIMRALNEAALNPWKFTEK